MKRKDRLYDGLLESRRLGLISEPRFTKRVRSHPTMIRRLQLDARLKGHGGCVSRQRMSGRCQHSAYEHIASRRCACRSRESTAMPLF
jgi:hypothetical protein